MLRLNNPVEALDYQRKAVAEAETLGDRRQLGLCYCDLGRAQILVGLLDEAQTNVETALKIFQETDDRSSPVKCTLNFAAIAIVQERYMDALTMLEADLQLCLAEKFEGLEFDVRQSLIFAVSALGRSDEAYTHLKAIAEMAQKESNEIQVLSVMICAACTLTADGQPERAAELWAMVDAHRLKDAEFELLWLPQVRTALDAALPFETLSAAFERGREGDYDSMAQTIITEFTAE